MANITGTIAPPVDNPIPGGTPVNGTLDVQLCGFGSMVPYSPGFALLGRITEQNIPVDANGDFEFTLIPNDEIEPAGTYYTVVVKDSNGDIAQINAYQFIGDGPFDLNSISPFDPNQSPLPLPPLILNQLLMVPFTPTPNFPGDEYLSWGIQLTGDVTSSTTSDTFGGNLYTFIISQDPVGGHLFAWPPNVFNAAPVNPNPSSITIQTFVSLANNGPMLAIGPATYFNNQ